MLLDLLSQEWVNNDKARVCLDYSAFVRNGRVIPLCLRFPDGINHRRRPFPLPNVTALLERSGNLLLRSIAARENNQRNN